MGASVHTIKPKFINKFSPPGGCLLLKETVITERRRGVGARHEPTRRRGENIGASACIWRMCSCESCKLNQSWFLPPAAVNRPEFRRPAGGQGSVPPPTFRLSHLSTVQLLCSVLCSPPSPRFNPARTLQRCFALVHNFDFIHLRGQKIQPGNSLTLIYRESVRNHFQIICLRITLKNFFFFFLRNAFRQLPWNTKLVATIFGLQAVFSSERALAVSCSCSSWHL